MVTRLKILICILLSLLTFAETVYGQEDCHCPAVVHLQRWVEGKILCQCNDFSLVSWYRSEEDYDNGGTPFIKYDNSETTGAGKISGEYDVGVNGSLIITNVSMTNHGMTYFCVFLRETQGHTERNGVKVEVLVIPDPPYPVVEGHIHQQHVYMDVSRDGKLSCSMRGVHPNVSLTWTVLDPSQSNKIQFQQDVMGTHKMQNDDGTYDITLSSMFRVTDHSIRRITIQCGVANEIGEYFSEKTKVALLFSADCRCKNEDTTDQNQHTDGGNPGNSSREQSGLEPFETSGDMETSFCDEKQADTGYHVLCSECCAQNYWIQMDIEEATFTHSMKAIVFAANCMTIPVMIAVQAIAAICMDILLLVVAKALRGKCYLRQEMPCRKRRYRQGQRMSSHWKIDFTQCFILLIVSGMGNSQEMQCRCHKEVYFERGEKGVIPCGCDEYDLVSWYTAEEFDISNGSPFIAYNNGNKEKTGEGYTSGDFDIGINGSLIIKDVDLSHSHDFVAVFLQQTKHRQDTNRVNVEVLVRPHRVFASVNSNAQERIYNNVERDGELCCTMLGIYPLVNLTFTVIDGSPSNTLQLQPGIQNSVQKEDGTFDVSYVSHYSADLDATVSLIACQITGQISKYLQAVTEVELHYSPVPTPTAAATPSLVPVIDGCYSKQENCVLKVKRTGDLTCTVKNSLQLVDLRWKTLDGDPSQLVFGEDKESTQNNICTSITTPYTVKDESLTVVTIQCAIWKLNSADVLSTVKVSLLISSDDDSVCSDFNILNVFLYATLFLIFWMLWMQVFFINRRLRKRIRNQELGREEENGIY